MNYSYLFNDISSLTPESIYNEHKQKFLKARSRKKELKEIERYLTSVFYGKDPKLNNITKSLEKAAIEYLESVTGKIINSFDFSQGSLDSGSDFDRTFKIALDEYEQMQHKTGVYAVTLKKRLEKIKKQLENISNIEKWHYNVRANKEVQEIKDNLRKCKEEIEKLLLQEASQITPKMGAKYNIDKYKDQIELIDDLYQKTTFLSSMPIPVWLMGDIFEKALQAVSEQAKLELIENVTEEELDKIIKDTFKASTKGSQTGNRGSYIKSTGAKLVEANNKKIKRNKNNKVEVKGENNSSFSLNTIFSDKQVKADVMFQMPSITRQTFRVSAKSWSGMDSKHGFGETGLAAAIIRTSSNVDKALSYGFSFYNPDKQPDAVLGFGKMCVLLDVLAGVSQKEGYADTIMINDKSESQIVVFSIGEILENANNLLMKESKQIYIQGEDKITKYQILKLKNRQRSNFNNRNIINEILINMNAIKMTLAYPTVKALRDES